MLKDAEGQLAQSKKAMKADLERCVVAHRLAARRPATRRLAPRRLA
jgi:hypothetical protein